MRVRGKPDARAFSSHVLTVFDITIQQARALKRQEEIEVKEQTGIALIGANLAEEIMTAKEKKTVNNNKKEVV